MNRINLNNVKAKENNEEKKGFISTRNNFAFSVKLLVLDYFSFIYYPLPPFLVSLLYLSYSSSTFFSPVFHYKFLNWNNPNRSIWSDKESDGWITFSHTIFFLIKKTAILKKGLISKCLDIIWFIIPKSSLTLLC